MTPLLEQFLSEARDALQGIGERLIQLEETPDDPAVINELFRLVHTLKGNSGLFDFPEMTRVLHAGEDLLDAVREGRLSYSHALADQLLDAADFVGILCDEAELEGGVKASHGADAVRLAEALRALVSGPAASPEAAGGAGAPSDGRGGSSAPGAAAGQTELPLAAVPHAIRLDAWQRARDGEALHWLSYVPAADCFFQGDDPFFTARQVPGVLWGRVVVREPWPGLSELDAYRCALSFEVLAAGPVEELDSHFRYVADQVRVRAVDPGWLVASQEGAPPGATVTRAVASPGLLAEERVALESIFAAQRRILELDDHPPWERGRIEAVAGVLIHCCEATGDSTSRGAIEAALEQTLALGNCAPLLAWLDRRTVVAPEAALPTPAAKVASAAARPAKPEEGPRFGRRTEDQAGASHLKVDKVKVDRLMNLIGEMIVSKNALPYLAQRAEVQYGVRDLARELTAQYAVINRIAEEMQDAIMQVRMMPVSMVFQRFHRLVRDLSHKLGKEVQLVLEGEETEADKNIIESLADPLIHIVRNSLDHGLESSEVRLACGKPAAGVLTLRATHEADRVRIDVLDDGRGIDVGTLKRKARDKGLIDQATFDRMTDREALNLVFEAGLSTAAVVSDVSGRGVGMDVVRTAVEHLNGTVFLESEVGRGTRISITVPLSMAVTQVMIVESDGQLFGVPIDHVVETVRVPRAALRMIKHSQTTALRGRIVPLRALNDWLNIPAEPRVNEDDELAVLMVRVGREVLGLVLDEFRETVDVIQKPLSGVLAGLSAYSGSALLGDGSVLMVLDPKEIV